jgi:ribonuclease R
MTPDDEILAAFPPPPQAMRVRELARRLGLDADGRSGLRDRLDALADQGRLERLRGNRFARVSVDGSAVGTLTVTANGYGFVAVEGGGEDVYVHGTNLGPAMHRDRVQVRLRPGSRGRVEGVVVKVLERGTRTFVGTFRTARKAAYVTPQDPRLPEHVHVADAGAAHDGDIVAAEIVRYDDDGALTARVLKIFGRDRAEVRETDLLVYDLGLRVEMPPEAEAEAEAFGEAVPEIERRRRRDLRERGLVTIDPESAKDFDDAVHAAPDGRGGWTLTVAVADVGQFVTAGSALDEEARARSTSIYLPDRVLPMLPHRLSGDLCSLLPEQDRLAMVVEVSVGPDGELGRYEIYEAVIRSQMRFTYERVARVLGLRGPDDAPVPDDEPAVEARRPMLEAVLHCTRALRRRRQKRGYLEIELPEPRIVLDPAGGISAVLPAVRTEAHQMIEEAMLAANEVVARHFTIEERAALFRVHDHPPDTGLARFMNQAAALGAPFEVKGRVTAARLTKYLRSLRGHPHERLLNMLLLRSMAQAVYSDEASLHFGLGTSFYLHFTSPIRRYPDLVVHRLIKEELRGVDAGYEPEALGALADECSRKERLAVDAERTVQDLYKALFLAQHVGEEFDGTVIGVIGVGLFVQIDEHFVEGLVPTESLQDDYYELDEQGATLVGRYTGRTFGLGDRLRIRVAAVDARRRRVELHLAGAVQRAARRPVSRGKRRR